MSALTRGPGTTVNGSVGTVAALALASNSSRNFVQIENTNASNTLTYTLDGTTPIANSVGFMLVAYGTATYDIFVPTGSINVIGSAAGTTYTIMWS